MAVIVSGAPALRRWRSGRAARRRPRRCMFVTVGFCAKSCEDGARLQEGQMLAQQRQASILDQVRRHGGVRVADLVRVLGVSDMTIRRDIEALTDSGLVAKVHGGAVAVD